MTPTKKPTVTVNVPKNPTTKKHHVPTENDYWRQFVKKHNLSSDQAQAISIAASGHSLPRLYLAALAVDNPGLLKNNNQLNKYAAKESARLGTSNTPNSAAIGLLPPKYAQSIHWKTWGTSATSSLGAAAVKGGLADPVLRDKNGKVITDDWGSPITRNAVLTEKLTYDDLFRQYVGRKMTTQEAVKFTKNHWSAHSIADQYLTKLPAFFKGKVFKQAYDGFLAGPGGWESVYGVQKNLKPPKELVRQALLRGNNGTAWFADQIRKLPQYKQSIEYKKFSADFSQVYNQIMGQVDDGGKKMIDEFIMQRKSAEQFAAELRKSPGYATSLEQRNLVEQSAAQAGIQLDYSQKVPATTVTKPKPGQVTNSQEPQPLPPYRPAPPHPSQAVPNQRGM